MSKFRYMFTVRQPFGQEPCLDGFYEVQSPEGMTNSEVEMWRTIVPGWKDEEIKQDSQTYHHLGLRLRFNSDMFQNVCLVKSDIALDREMLEAVVVSKYIDGTLMDFLKKSAI